MEGAFMKQLIAILILITTMGCMKEWQMDLWFPESSTDDQATGSLETDTERFDILVTEFRKIDANRPSFVGISITCKNTADETRVLGTSPIQAIDASKTLVQRLPSEHVIYTVYGGRVRERRQEDRLRNLQDDYPNMSSPLLNVALGVAGITEAISIMDDMYAKESATYGLYYREFVPSSLPPGTNTTWTEYYPYTAPPITVILQGQKVEDGIAFRPRPAGPRDEGRIRSGKRKVHLLVGGIAVAFVGLILVSGS